MYILAICVSNSHRCFGVHGNCGNISFASSFCSEGTHKHKKKQYASPRNLFPRPPATEWVQESTTMAKCIGDVATTCISEAAHNICVMLADWLSITLALPQSAGNLYDLMYVEHVITQSGLLAHTQFSGKHTKFPHNIARTCTMCTGQAGRGRWHRRSYYRTKRFYAIC